MMTGVISSSDEFVSQDSGDSIHNDFSKNDKAWNDEYCMIMRDTISSSRNYFDTYEDDCDEDGYPTDEYTVNSWAQSRGKESKRRHLLQLAHNRIAMRKHAYQPEDIIVTQDDDDDSSFLANADMEDIESANNDLHEDAPLFDSFGREDFLAHAQIKDVEQQSDTSSFLASAEVDDRIPASNNMRLSRDDETTTLDSCYNMYASSLSKADSTNAATLGDLITMRESSVTGGAENESIDTYSYNRAYVDNVTLGESNFTSNFSALTDDYCYDARKVGMAEEIKVDAIHERESFGSGSKGSNVDVVNCETGPDAIALGCNRSLVESLPAPPPLPPHHSSHTGDLIAFGDVEHLIQIRSFGEDNGYVDEEAAVRYAAANRICWSCAWFTSSSRFVKLIVLCSAFMLLGSVTSLALAFFWPDVIQNNMDKPSRWNEGSANMVDDGKQDTLSRGESVDNQLQTVMVIEECYDGAECYDVGSICADGSTESCCGETYNSILCECSLVDDTLKYQCLSNNACVTPCNDSAPGLVSSDTPSTLLMRTTDSPSNMPSPVPTGIPTQTKDPTNEPTIHPTSMVTDGSLSEQVPSVNPIATSLAQLAELMHTFTVQSSRDTYVIETDSFTNFGTSERLRVDETPRTWSIITFDMSSVLNDYSESMERNVPQAIQVVKVIHAKLRLYSLDEGENAIISALPNAKQWAETKLTWNSVGKLNRSNELQIGSIARAQPFKWNEVDVTDVFAINDDFNVMSFMIHTTSFNGITFASRERESGKFSPELVVTMDTAGVHASNLFHSSSILNSPTSPPLVFWPTYSPTSDEDTTKSV